MQPYFFPYIGYWQLIHAADRFVVYDDVNYIMRGWINRNRIINHGDSVFLTAPIAHASPNKRICDSALQSHADWRNKMLKTLNYTYGKAPHFKTAFPILEEIILFNSLNLSGFLTNQLQTIARYLAIDTEFITTSQHYDNQQLSRQERVIDICKRESASLCINPQGGTLLYDREIFLQNDITLKFLIPNPVPYKQFSDTHLPWLSIIDIMMFNSQAEIRTMLDKYQLV